MAKQIKFEDLEAHHCRYPSGDGSKKSPFRFCGEDKLRDGPYCSKHAAICFNGKPARDYYMHKAERKKAA